MKLSNPLKKIAAIAFVALGAIIILIYYYGAAGGRLPFAGHLYTVNAELQDSQGVLKHADVRAAGVKVGSVSDISNTSTQTGTMATVQMQLDTGYGPIYRNATVLVRQKTLVGENYIEITRGTPSAGTVPDGGALPLSQDLQSVPLDKVLNALTPPVRKQLQIDLQSLGAGVNHEGKNLNEFLGALQPTVYNGGQVFGVLSAQKQELANIVQQTGTVMGALANRTQDLRTLIASGEVTAQAVAGRDRSLSQAFVDLPATLAQARTSIGVLNGFSAFATPTIANLRVAVTKLGPVMSELKPTAAAARTLFDILPAFLHRANPLLTNLKAFAKVAKPAIPAIDSLTSQADPALNFLKPYYRDVGNFLQNFGGTFQRENIAGTYIGRCLCPFSAESYAQMTPAEQALVQALLKAGVGGIANPNSNSLRPPGSAPNFLAGYSGTYPHITALPPTPLRK
jgi:phospholipid/cholesterol/gamma-HCH transport system substrate-binding protein